MTSGIFLAESSDPSIPKLLLLGHFIIATIKAADSGSILLEARGWSLYRFFVLPDVQGLSCSRQGQRQSTAIQQPIMPHCLSMWKSFYQDSHGLRQLSFIVTLVEYTVNQIEHKIQTKMQITLRKIWLWPFQPLPVELEVNCFTVTEVGACSPTVQTLNMGWEGTLADFQTAKNKKKIRHHT